MSPPLVSSTDTSFDSNDSNVSMSDMSSRSASLLGSPGPDFVARPQSAGKVYKAAGEDETPWKNKMQLKTQPRRALF
jgi:hypothetical protein